MLGGRLSHFADRRRFSKHARTTVPDTQVVVICCRPRPRRRRRSIYLQVDFLFSADITVYIFYRTFYSFIDSKKMESRARNTFVLLTIVLAFAVQCITSADLSANTNTANPAPANPAPANSAPVNPATAIPAHNPAPANGSPPAETVAKAESAPLTTNNNASKQLVEIEVYYEALCSDSLKFVSNELLPTFNKLNKFINVTFIPFAQGIITKDSNNSLNFTCRRTGECDADRVHACGINKIKDSEKLINFVNCSLAKGIESPNKTVPIDVCGKNSDIDSAIITEITSCANSSESNPWLQDYANKSSIAHVKSVPKVIINKNSSEAFTTNNFMQQVCKQIPDKDLPAECKPNSSGSDTLVIGVLPIIIGAFYFIKMI